jgi:hypothetical protein
MKIHALEQIVVSGASSYPIYVGFVKAEDLLSVSEVPSFRETTPNHDIASNVLNPPVKEWQRPLMPHKRERITNTFNGTGEFMPNPVLVAERRVGPAPAITISDLKAAGGISTGVKVIDIAVPAPGTPPPLWIIDGQHRITGLGDVGCAQKDNFIPLVLLLNNGGTFYNGTNLAKVFAQVTTEATPLDVLHKEWLTFAFELDMYRAGTPQRRAMEAVANLCKMPHNSVTGKPNGFHDDIKFNDKLSGTPKYLGHQYDCKDMSSILSLYYYEESATAGHLRPLDLATQVSTAFEALKECVRAPQAESVFFGSDKHCHKIMIDAFLVGALTYLRVAPATPSKADWDNLLKTLHFDLTNWNFQQHVISSSRWVDKSKSLALDVFSQIFRDQQLPSRVNDVWDYLSGDQLTLEMEFKHVNSSGKAIKKGRHVQTFGRGDKKTVAMDGRSYFKVLTKSINAKHIELVDEKSSPANPITFKATGEYTRPPKIDLKNKSQSPLVITVKCTVYGGLEEKITVSLAGWK